MNARPTTSGARPSLAIRSGSHNARVGGTDSFSTTMCCSDSRRTRKAPQLTQKQAPTGHVEVLFAEDQFTATDWLTLNGGVRVTHFSGTLTENAVSPRVGVAFRIPRVEWAVRGFFGRYYQPPPLIDRRRARCSTWRPRKASGFSPCKGERDEQYEFGVAIPVRGWAIDTDYFRTNARQLLRPRRRSATRTSSFPLTIDRARIRGLEADAPLAAAPARAGPPGVFASVRRGPRRRLPGG